LQIIQGKDKKQMWVNQFVLAIIGLSSGLLVAGGIFSFIVSLGVVSDFADRTHTGNHILLYENAIMLGAVWGNAVSMYGVPVLKSDVLLGLFGVFAGIFVGCWAMALAEILNVFPIFVRRVKLVKCIPYIILSIAIGKGIGAVVYFFFGW
jgi:stage V sporulation protein AB